MNFENINGWVGVIGAIVAIIIAVTKRVPETANLNANTIKTLTESVQQANKNYTEVNCRVELMEATVTALEKTVAEYEAWNKALVRQLVDHGIKPITLEEVLRYT